MSRSVQRDRVTGDGFVAALDQSGGSTPKALGLYGVETDAWDGEEEMFDLVHQMRSRIITSPAFSGNRILGAILFEQTMERSVAGRLTADYLWQVKGVVPFLKIDKGLADEVDGAQVMKPVAGLDDLLGRARAHGIFGTKMRSVVHRADAGGVAAVLDQQLDVARQVLEAGLVPIVEPEISIEAPDKREAEDLLLAGLRERLDALPAGNDVMLKLTLPEVDDHYAELVAHPRVLRVVALSGGYARQEACDRLARQHGVIASFSRALTEGLTVQQTDEEFDTALDASVEMIYRASIT